MGRLKGQTIDAIHKGLIQLEAQRAEALAHLAQCEGDERVRVRVHLTMLERRLNWYRGYVGTHYQQRGLGSKPWAERKAARKTQGLTEIHEVFAQGRASSPQPDRPDRPVREDSVSETQVDNTGRS